MRDDVAAGEKDALDSGVSLSGDSTDSTASAPSGASASPHEPVHAQDGSRTRNAKCGVVAVIGRPSAGKSTLINKLCGAKVSIVSPAPQTTRNSIRGIANRPGAQIIFIDTPGYHTSEKKMNLKLQSISKERLSDADCILYVIDTTRDSGEEEDAISNILAAFSQRVVVALNKTDSGDARPGMAKLYVFRVLPDVPASRIVEVSAQTGENTEPLLNALIEMSPDGAPLYPADYYTDQEVDFRISEIIREKVMLNTRDEIPHSVYVEIADMEMRRKGKELFVRAFVIAERDSQKAVLIGKNASMIRKIKEESIADFKKIFPYYIILDLQVKVNKNWRQKDSFIGKFY